MKEVNRPEGYESFYGSSKNEFIEFADYSAEEILKLFRRLI